MNHTETLSDEALIEHIRSGNKEQYAEIVHRYETRLLRYVVSLIHDQDRAADIVQEAFIKAYVNLHGFDAEKKFSSWIYRIAHNETINTLRKTKKEFSLNPDFDTPSNDPSALENISRAEIINAIRTCLSTLPLIYAEPLELFFLEEKSYEDIGDILRIPQGTVATRLNRGKKLLSTLCKKHTTALPTA